MSVASWGVDAFRSVSEHLPRTLRGNLMVKAFAFSKIPMLAFAGPKVEELSDDHCVVRIPLNWRTRNHLDVMYIGVLVAGADVAGGIMAMEAIAGADRSVHLLFKDLQADFVRRADGDVRFRCDEGQKVRQAVAETVKTGERVNVPVNIVATVERQERPREVARFVLTLTMKARG